MLKQASATKFKQTLGLKGLRASGVFAPGPPLGSALDVLGGSQHCSDPQLHLTELPIDARPLKCFV